jgi:hypothetical protein
MLHRFRFYLVLPTSKKRPAGTDLTFRRVQSATCSGPSIPAEPCSQHSDNPKAVSAIAAHTIYYSRPGVLPWAIASLANAGRPNRSEILREKFNYQTNRQAVHP